MLKKGFNESRMIAFFNKKNRKRLLYVAVVKETTMLDLKLSLLNHFIKSFRNSISGFRLVRKGPPEDDDNDTISDNYFDDKFNDEKVFDFLNLIESKQLYEKRKDGTFFIYFRAIKLTLNITIIQSGDTQNFTFPLSLKDNTITKFIHDIEEKIQEPLNEPYHIFQNNQNLDKISEEDDMKQYSESGLIMFLFPIQVDFIDKSTQKKAKILFKSNEPLSIYLPKIFELLSIQNDPSDYYFENNEEKIDIELPIINFLRKKQQKNEFIIEINKNDFDLKYYDIISKIGEGSFSNVYKIKNTKTNQYFAAKITKFMIDEDTEKSEQTCFLYREVNLMSSFNHPSILKFIGYNPLNFKNESFPTLITEFASNGSLRNLIELENSGLSLNGWDITKKLIIIYGIASGISYLHKHNVLHRDLKTTNILIDEYLHPKIADFGLSKLTDFLSISMNMQSKKGLKGTIAYLSPEILNNEEYSKKGDVYAFAFIVFELMTGDVPYNDLNSFKLMDLVNQGFRPNIRDDVPDSYRELIESCWSQDPNDRPSFDDIVEILKENEGFITDTTDEAEFFDYVDFIDNYQSTFDTSKHVIHFSEFIENHGRNKNVKMFNINEIESKD